MPLSCNFSTPVQQLHQLSDKQNGEKYIEKFYRTPMFYNIGNRQTSQIPSQTNKSLIAAQLMTYLFAL